VRRRHVHQPCPRKTVECPQSADRKDDAGLPGVVSAGSRNWPPSLVAQENFALPIVQTGEPDPVGEFQDGDDIARHSGLKPNAESAARSTARQLQRLHNPLFSRQSANRCRTDSEQRGDLGLRFAYIEELKRMRRLLRR